jgi:hypothetical protein
MAIRGSKLPRRGLMLAGAMALSAAIVPAAVAKGKSGPGAPVKSSGPVAFAKDKKNPPKPKTEPYLKVELKDVMVSSYSTSARQAPKTPRAETPAGLSATRKIKP